MTLTSIVYDAVLLLKPGVFVIRKIPILFNSNFKNNVEYIMKVPSLPMLHHSRKE